jgi:hypothetical protein
MPAYGSIEQLEHRHSKTNYRMVVAVLSGMLLLVAAAGAVRFIKFHESHGDIAAKLFQSPHESQDRVALEQLSASLDRQLEALNQLEAKVLPRHLVSDAASAHVAASGKSLSVTSDHVPEGKSESFLADIIGIKSPAMETQQSRLVQATDGAKPNSSALLSSSYLIIVSMLALFCLLL